MKVKKTQRAASKPQRIGNSTIFVKHNGQPTWNAKVYRAASDNALAVIREKAPVSWFDQIEKGTTRVWFRDTLLGRQEMGEFISLAQKLVVVGIARKIPAPGENRSYKEAASVVEVEFDSLTGEIDHNEYKPGKWEFSLRCRIIRRFE